jgi:hypothetical protein
VNIFFHHLTGARARGRHTRVTYEGQIAQDSYLQRLGCDGARCWCLVPVRSWCWCWRAVPESVCPVPVSVSVTISSLLRAKEREESDGELVWMRGGREEIGEQRWGVWVWSVLQLLIRLCEHRWLKTVSHFPSVNSVDKTGITSDKKGGGPTKAFCEMRGARVTPQGGAAEGASRNGTSYRVHALMHKRCIVCEVWSAQQRRAGELGAASERAVRASTAVCVSSPQRRAQEIPATRGFVYNIVRRYTRTKKTSGTWRKAR